MIFRSIKKDSAKLIDFGFFDRASRRSAGAALQASRNPFLRPQNRSGAASPAACRPPTFIPHALPCTGKAGTQIRIFAYFRNGISSGRAAGSRRTKFQP